MRKVILCLFILTILTSSAALANQIKPDYGIDGVIYLGNTKDQVIASWGQPTMSIPAEVFLGVLGKNCEGYFYTKYSIGLIFDKDGRIIYIATSSTKHATVEGIKVGDGLNAVLNTYGSDYYKEKTIDPKYDYRIRYEKLGYEFRFKNDKVTDIGVFYKK